MEQDNVEWDEGMEWNKAMWNGMEVGNVEWDGNKQRWNMQNTIHTWSLMTISLNKEGCWAITARALSILEHLSNTGTHTP